LTRQYKRVELVRRFKWVRRSKRIGRA